jgi:hypothetical protein
MKLKSFSYALFSYSIFNSRTLWWDDRCNGGCASDTCLFSYAYCLYLSALVNLMKSLDPTRAITFVTSQTADKDQAVSSQWSQKLKNVYAETMLMTFMCLYQKNKFGRMNRPISFIKHWKQVWYWEKNWKGLEAYYVYAAFSLHHLNNEQFSAE